MNIRAELNINGGTKRVLLVQKDEETDEHVSLRLAANIMFFKENPTIEVSPYDPLITNVNFLPDLLVSDPIDGIKIWIECGTVATNKLIKVARRTKHCRFIIIKENPELGKRVHEVLKKEIRDYGRIEVLAFPEGEFERWHNAINETPYVFGEASDSFMNLVLNESTFDVKFVECNK